MDDALALRVKRRSRFQKQVLILVVMDDALAPLTLLMCSSHQLVVLILVVMDDALAPIFVEIRAHYCDGLNPCCNG